MLITSPEFTSNLTGKTYYTKSFEPLDCSTKNVIYGIECTLCGLLYVGETRQTLRSRMSQHRYDAKDPKYRILYNHFNQPGHKVHILSSPACSCGAPQEDANHFFFVCTKYSLIRNELFLSISDLSQSINTSLLTSGSETLSYADNCFIFYSVFRFIKRSKRFLIV